MYSSISPAHYSVSDTIRGGFVGCRVNDWWLSNIYECCSLKWLKPSGKECRQRIDSRTMRSWHLLATFWVIAESTYSSCVDTSFQESGQVDRWRGMTLPNHGLCSYFQWKLRFLFSCDLDLFIDVLYLCSNSFKNNFTNGIFTMNENSYNALLNYVSR